MARKKRKPGKKQQQKQKQRLQNNTEQPKKVNKMKERKLKEKKKNPSFFVSSAIIKSIPSQKELHHFESVSPTVEDQKSFCKVQLKIFRSLKPPIADIRMTKKAPNLTDGYKITCLLSSIEKLDVVDAESRKILTWKCKLDSVKRFEKLTSKSVKKNKVIMNFTWDEVDWKDEGLTTTDLDFEVEYTGPLSKEVLLKSFEEEIENDQEQEILKETAQKNEGDTQRKEMLLEETAPEAAPEAAPEDKGSKQQDGNNSQKKKKKKRANKNKHKSENGQENGEPKQKKQKLKIKIDYDLIDH